MNLSKKTFILLTLITILATFLRLFNLGKIPPALYTDEANQGYNAYSIMMTARDEHGILLPVSLRSFGDWKPPLPTYLMIPFIYILGLTESSVRLPSAIFGIGSVILAFFLIRRLLDEQKYKTKIGLIASLYLAISPWHILQSRSAMLVVIGLFFLLLGIFSFLSINKNKLFIFLSTISFTLSIYSYYGLRVVTPLILLFLLFHYRRELALYRRQLILAVILGFILVMPLLDAFIKQSDVILGRARTVSVFYDQGINLKRWELTAQDGVNSNTLITRFFHNNYYLYGRDIIQRFLSHLDGRFLFLTGDTTPPFQIPRMGILYIADLFFILIGIIVLFKQKLRSRWLIVFWIFVAILPAAFTFITPSSNRTFNSIVMYGLLAALGMSFINQIAAKKIYVVTIIIAIYIAGFGYFMHQYFIKLPLTHADWWNYGWKEVVNYVKDVEPKYNNIIVSDTFGMPYIYFLFYQKYPPDKYQKYAIRSYAADRYGFEHVEGFSKYIFQNDFDWSFTKKNNLQRSSLYVVPANQANEHTDYTKAIYYPNGKIAFKIFAYE